MDPGGDLRAALAISIIGRGHFIPKQFNSIFSVIQYLRQGHLDPS
jgi:hypothetical protein